MPEHGLRLRQEGNAAFLNSWLQNCNLTGEWPASEIAQTLECILDDGVVTKDEKSELKRLIESVSGATVQAAPAAAVRESSTTIPSVSAVRAAPFVVIDLKQGSREWLAWRHNGVGASDASTIMGENPWKTPADLLEEKRGPARTSDQNAAMSMGTELEPDARKRYIVRTGRHVQPACLQSTYYEWLRASLDGLSVNHDSAVEIKCGQSAYRKASTTATVPDYYYGQLQHILAVTGLESIDFWCYWPGCREVLIPVRRDPGYIELLLKMELQFWEDVQRRR